MVSTQGIELCVIVTISLLDSSSDIQIIDLSGEELEESQEKLENAQHSAFDRHDHLGFGDCDESDDEVYTVWDDTNDSGVENTLVTEEFESSTGAKSIGKKVRKSLL